MAANMDDDDDIMGAKGLNQVQVFEPSDSEPESDPDDWYANVFSFENRIEYRQTHQALVCRQTYYSCSQFLIV